MGDPPNLRHSAKTPLQCRQIFEDSRLWATNLRAVKLRSTGWAPTVLPGLEAAADALRIVRGKGPTSYRFLSGKMLPLVLCRSGAVHTEVATASSSNSKADRVSH